MYSNVDDRFNARARERLPTEKSDLLPYPPFAGEDNFLMLLKFFGLEQKRSFSTE